MWRAQRAWRPQSTVDALRNRKHGRNTVFASHSSFECRQSTVESTAWISQVNMKYVRKLTRLTGNGSNSMILETKKFGDSRYVQTWRYSSFAHARLSTSTEARGLLHSDNGSNPRQEFAGSVPVSSRCFLSVPSMSQFYDQMISVETESPVQAIMSCIHMNIFIYVSHITIIYIYIFLQQEIFTNI